jgi:hypothetical protein
MNIRDNWDDIRLHFNTSFKSNLHVAVASVNNENIPTVTPIGSMFLNKDLTGFYFEKFVTKIPNNIKTNKNICVLIVNSSKWFWLKSLFKGRFKNYPAIKLYGVVGEKRKANSIECSRFKKRTNSSKRLKGHNYLWGDMNEIREISFYKAEKINLGQMTQ